jgi:hypothetical protein
VCILCARKCVSSGGSASCRTIRQLGCLKVEKQLEKIMMRLTIADEAELLNKGELIKSSLSLEQALED